MLIAILIITTIVCAIGWVKGYISTLALLYYIKKKGYTYPSDSEIKECTQWVVKKLNK